MNKESVTPSGMDVLRSLAARMPRVVKEHEVLRIAANVFGKDTEKAAKTARREVLNWAQKRCGGNLPPEAWQYGEFDYFSAGRNSSAIRIQNSAADIWAVRAEDPDKTIPGRVWTTEVVVGLQPDKQPRFSLRLLASTVEDALDIEPHPPGLVQQVAEACGLTLGGYALRPDASVINDEEGITALTDMLVSPTRHLPLIILTVPTYSADEWLPLLDAAVLARATVGIAHVAIVPASLTWVLTERFGKIRSVFGGAARIYLPGFSEDADPYVHTLFLADRLQTAEEKARASRTMRLISAAESLRRTKLGSDVLSFASIRSAHLQLVQDRLEETGASSDEKLAAATNRIEALERQVQDSINYLQYYEAEHAKAEARAASAEEQGRASAYRIQQLLDQIKLAGAKVDASIKLPEKWDDFANWCDVNLAGRLILTPLARHQVSSPEFDDVKLVARCLLWLANECRDRRLNGGDGSLRDEAIEEGVRNAHCGGDQFEFRCHGGMMTADWHVKNGGNTRNPSRCLRIYYGWDKNVRQIVVAEMPAHRKTDAS